MGYSMQNIGMVLIYYLKDDDWRSGKHGYQNKSHVIRSEG